MRPRGQRVGRWLPVEAMPETWTVAVQAENRREKKKKCDICFIILCRFMSRFMGAI